MPGTTRTVALLLIGLAVAACEGMRELLTLRNQLAEAFQTPEAGVRLTSGVLTVTLQNSPLDGRTGAEEQAICRQVAEFVRDHFRQYAAIRKVHVAFASRQGAVGVSITRSRTPCTFTHEDLGEPVTEEATVVGAEPGGTA